MTRTRWRAILFVLLFLAPARTFAHGGAGVSQIDNQELGPYRIFVWSDPEPPRVGEYHVTIALSESLENDSTGLSGPPVLDAKVTVEMVHVESGATLTAPATHEDALNKVFYAAEFAPQLKGEWRVRIIVESPDGPVETGYVDTIEAKTFPWTAVLGGIVALLLAVGGFVLYRRVQPTDPQAVPEGAAQ